MQFEIRDGLIFVEDLTFQYFSWEEYEIRLPIINTWLLSCSKEVNDAIITWFREIKAILDSFPLLPVEQDQGMIVPILPIKILPLMRQYLRESTPSEKSLISDTLDEQGQLIIFSSEDRLHLTALAFCGTIIDPLLNLARKQNYELLGDSYITLLQAFTGLRNDSGTMAALNKISQVSSPGKNPKAILVSHKLQ